jgi:hypothetical protein
MPAPDGGKRLRILTWHVHGNYLYYLTQAPHDFYLVTKPGHPPGYGGRTGALPWGENVREVAYDRVASLQVDCVLYQHKTHYFADRLHVLSEPQRRLPRIYLEHDPPQDNPFAQLHWAQDAGLKLVHVTQFNRLMWDSGITPATVVEHGVLIPDGAKYTGELPKGIVVVNHLRERGRRLGNDVFAAVRTRVPLDLAGMDAESLGGVGEIPNPELPAYMARYRFFFNPIRWTSLGLAVIEAMTVGMPIVGLATAELATIIRSGENGYVDADPDRLCSVMQMLLDRPALAAEWGQKARRTAEQRFSIARFVADWNRVFGEVTA